MKKSFVSLAMASVMALGIGLSGCSSDSSPSVSPPSSTTSSSASASSSASSGTVTIDSIKKAGALKIGTDLTYKPYEYMDDSGNPTGYDFEIWQNIAKDLGVKLEYQDLAFAGIFTGLETGKYDVAGCNCMINTERAKKYNFCRPVYSSKYTIVKQSNDDSIQSVEDLKGKKVGAQLGSSTQQAVEKYDQILKTKLGSGMAEIKHYNLSTDAFLDLTNGNIDAVCESNSICDQQVSQSDGKLKTVGTILDPVYTSFAFRKTDTELLDYVNSEIDKFKKDGTLYTLQEKYFGSEIKDLPDDESQYIPQ